MVVSCEEEKAERGGKRLGNFGRALLILPWVDLLEG
jgi:hypothetical protein